MMQRITLKTTNLNIQFSYPHLHEQQCKGTLKHHIPSQKKITFKYDFADLNVWRRSEVCTFSLSTAIKYGTCTILDDQFTEESSEVFHFTYFHFSSSLGSSLKQDSQVKKKKTPKLDLIPHHMHSKHTWIFK
jgi:hypothetical protein